MLSVYLLAQFFGILAFGAQLYSGQAHCGRKIAVFLGASNLIWIGHYIVLEAHLAAIICVLAALRLIGSVYINQKYLPHIVYGSISLFIVAAFFTYDGSHSLLPLFGSTLLSLSLLKRDNAFIVRFGSFASCMGWTLHGLYTGSVIEVLANTTAIIPILYGFYKHDLPVLRETATA